MGNVTNAAKAGFGGTLGSFGAMAIFGLVVALGVALAYSARENTATGKERNNTLMILGIILIVLGSLPFLPFWVMSALPGLLGDN